MLCPQRRPRKDNEGWELNYRSLPERLFHSQSATFNRSVLPDNDLDQARTSRYAIRALRSKPFVNFSFPNTRNSSSRPTVSLSHTFLKKQEPDQQCRSYLVTPIRRLSINISVSRTPAMPPSSSSTSSQDIKCTFIVCTRAVTSRHVGERTQEYCLGSVGGSWGDHRDKLTRLFLDGAEFEGVNCLSSWP